MCRDRTDASQLRVRIGTRQGVETFRNRILDALADVFGNDAYGVESMSAKMGKSVHDIVWNHREGGREGFRLPQQSVRVEAGQQTIGDERVHVPGSEVFLLEIRPDQTC